MPLSRQPPKTVPDSIVKFFDVEIKPPRGGWTFPIGGRNVTGYSENEIFTAFKKWQVNNGQFVSDDAVTRAMWQFWCAREPQRCGMLPGDVAAAARILQPRDVDKDLQGPPIWMFLNTLAVQWNEGMHPYFLATCNAILGILVCPDCLREWRTILNDYPPSAITSRLACCQWVNLVHNEVNKRKGGAIYPYERMVIEWGAPVA